MEKKICGDCGAQKSVEDFYLNGFNKKTGKLYYTKRCRKCHNEKCHKKWVERCEKDPSLRLKMREKISKWKKANPEKNREYVKRSLKKLKEEDPKRYRECMRKAERNKRKNKTDNFRDRLRRKSQRQRDELRDCYIRKQLGGNKYNSLIPIKREQLKLLRLCKKLESTT